MELIRGKATVYIDGVPFELDGTFKVCGADAVEPVRIVSIGDHAWSGTFNITPDPEVVAVFDRWIESIDQETERRVKALKDALATAAMPVSWSIPANSPPRRRGRAQWKDEQSRYGRRS